MSGLGAMLAQCPPGKLSSEAKSVASRHLVADLNTMFTSVIIVPAHRPQRVAGGDE